MKDTEAMNFPIFTTICAVISISLRGCKIMPCCYDGTNGKEGGQ